MGWPACFNGFLQLVKGAGRGWLLYAVGFGELSLSGWPMDYEVFNGVLISFGAFLTIGASVVYFH